MHYAFESAAKNDLEYITRTKIVLLDGSKQKPFPRRTLQVLTFAWHGRVAFLRSRVNAKNLRAGDNCLSHSGHVKWTSQFDPRRIHIDVVRCGRETTQFLPPEVYIYIGVVEKGPTSVCIWYIKYISIMECLGIFLVHNSSSPQGNDRTGPRLAKLSHHSLRPKPASSLAVSPGHPARQQPGTQTHPGLPGRISYQFTIKFNYFLTICKLSSFDKDFILSNSIDVI